MARTSASLSALAALLLAIAGCREQITAPGRCPALCPPGNVQLADTLLAAPVASDTSVRGYVLVREAAFLLASSLDSLKSVVLIRFSPLADKWFLTSDTNGVPVTSVDSVLLLLHVGQRDTAVKPLKVVFHRLPAQFDTASTYAQIQLYLADSLLVDTVAIEDSVQSGSVTLHLPISLKAPPADSGVVSVAVTVAAPAPTAFAVGSGNLSSAAPVLEYFVRGRRLQDTLARTTMLPVSPTFATFVMSPDPGQPSSGVLSVGGMPSARATLGMTLPRVVVDSNAIVRATLILNPVRPAAGFARDSFYLEARPLLRDFGTKSILYPDSSIAGHTLIHEGQSGPVELDVTPILRLWGTTTGDSLPRTLVLRMAPEGQVLGSMDFKGRAAGAAGPQLRVTYVRRYSFGVP